MTNNTNDAPQPTSNQNDLPFVAECRDIPLNAPWRWLKMGFADLRKAPKHSLFLGFLMSALVMLVLYLAFHYGRAWMMLSMLCGFVFMAPLSCIAIYAISAQLERDQPVSVTRALRASLKRHIGTEMVFALVLLIVFLVWARATSMVSIFIPEIRNIPSSEMVNYLIIVVVVSTLFLGITFSASVFALPMIMHRDVDAITAVLTSINAVFKNKLAMLWCALLLTLGFLIGIVTGGLLLIPFLPTIGHAVWHGYLESIDASPFPRHKVGITATERHTK